MSVSINFNPFTGNFDFVGTSGSPTVQNPNYIAIFNNTGSWAGPDVNSNYFIIIPASTHGKGVNPMIQVMELIGSNYDSIICSYQLAANGDLTLLVSQTPDLRFSGKITIAENN